jgi:shikimate dehydrogenase
MHAAAFQALGVRATYRAIRTGPRELAPMLRALARNGGGGNVTYPLKHAAAKVVDTARGAATVVGTCNTFWSDAGRIVGDNTDVAGVVAAVESLEVPAGGWLVIGTGASARAVAAAACGRGAPVAVHSRDASRGSAFLAWATTIGAVVTAPAECVLVVNTAPPALRDDAALPHPRAGIAALDLTYARGETAWVRVARAAGLRAADGRGLLVAQGGASLECWFPGVVPPIAVMRRAVDAALA